ncbi:hypothetical protein FN846DRAFT_922983 [Sphaerosporella brunnea]|uniref:Uncharacterized protein n=1 Tax=Sphaerosporella brunnea TaxID=1250544 RepID=A0A5J5EFD6_9PEZI|nr:hypothetical protein FN846DRAFT_922983 [Sphaerosporella brunnea]
MPRTEDIPLHSGHSDKVATKRQRRGKDCVPTTPSHRITRSQGAHKSQKVLQNEAFNREQQNAKQSQLDRRATRQKRKEWESLHT